MPRSAAPRDAITDVPGIRVGHWTNRRAATGCTVVLCPPAGAVAACAPLGGAPGTRETDVLLPGNLVKRAHAVLLTGGSAFGLDAATGVMRWLAERDIGFETHGGRVPIVPAAVIYDLGIGRADVRPDAAAGYAACAAAGAAVPQGSVGAGTGATVAKLAGPAGAVKGGLGTASERTHHGAIVGAIAVANGVGEIVDPASGRILAPVRPPAVLPPVPHEDAIAHLRRRGSRPASPLENTTIAVVATDVLLDREQLYRLALMAHAGIARTVRPSHTIADGDTVFALATGTRVEERPDIGALGALAAHALARAILNGVRRATALAGVPAVATPVTVRPVTAADRAWIEPFIVREWGAPVVVSCGVAHRPAELDGFVAELAGRVTGLVTVHVRDAACEVVTINSLARGSPAARALMDAARDYARARGCRRLWLVTTNDNLHALRFYQRYGLRIVAVRPGAVDAARQLKPEIPLTGADGIPLRDEIELALDL
jgi:L-aminopeptidase/D-esterase-like protein/N-acetylglutamate synthase-like GNAT family acetyltransferase